MVANGPLAIDQYVGVRDIRITVYYTGTISEMQPIIVLILPFTIGVFTVLKRRKY